MFGLTWAKLLNPKLWFGIAIVAILSWAGYLVYDSIWQKGYDERTAEVQKKIDELTSERNQAQTKLKEYKTEYGDWVKNTKDAQEKYLAEQKLDLEQRQQRLAAAEKALRNKPTTIREVVKYVPAEVDASYRLPVGFVRLYRESIEGSAAPINSSNVFSQSQFVDAGEASGITMSQFGQIAASNNAECVLRGKIIEEWQGWFEVNSKSFEAIRNWQLENGPKVPDSSTSSSIR